VLADAGLQPWPSPAAAIPAADCLLLYDSPDRLISALPEQESAAAFTLQQLIDGYTTLLSWAQQTGLPLLCGWQLERLGATGLRQWLSDAEVPPHPVEHAAIAPLIAATTLSLLEAQPSLHEVYADLELQAQLLGREPDLHYRQRLRQQASGQGDALLQALLETLQTPAAVSDLEQQLATKDGELRDAREEAELTLLQLHQVQEELEAIFLADRDRQQQLATKDGELNQLKVEHEGLRQQHESRLSDLEQQLAAQTDATRQAEQATRQAEQARDELAAQAEGLEAEKATATQRSEELNQQLATNDGELRDAREEAELTLLQLHQVQEELEHYFLLARGQDQLLGRYGDQQLRVQKLLAQLTASADPAAAAQSR
jgi:hypothetical protein